MANDQLAAKLNACGLPLVNPGGRQYVDLAYSYVVTVSIPAGDVTPVLLYDQDIVVRESAEFWLRRIHTSQINSRLVWWRWGAPGRWMMSDRANLDMTLGIGSDAKGLNQVRFAPGSKILYEIESQAVSPLDFQLIFDGVERYYL